jgi:hypothetical protein
MDVAHHSAPAAMVILFSVREGGMKGPMKEKGEGPKVTTVNVPSDHAQLQVNLCVECCGKMGSRGRH